MMRFLRTTIVVLVFLLCGSALSSAQSTFNINLDFIRQAVVFLRVVDEHGKPLELGTGFLVRIPLKSDPSKVYVLLATARHIADPSWTGCAGPAKGTLMAVFNKKLYDPARDPSGTLAIPLSPSWLFPDDDSADVAVTVLNAGALQTIGADFSAIPITDFVTPEESEKIGAGAQIASAGLLVGTAGLKRNYPIFKFGYVSSIPDELMPVDCGKRSTRQWLLAASLVGGNSGSPVFFVPVGFPGLSMGDQRAALLGIQSTSFEGADVAGMAPAKFLLDAIRKAGLPDANVGAWSAPLKPTAGPSNIPAPVSGSAIPEAHPSAGATPQKH